MTRRWWIGGAAVVLLASGLWAKQGTIRLKDGSPPVAGDIDDSNPASVTITIHGVQETIPRENVASIEYAANFDDQYNDRMKKLDPKDAPGRIEVAHWAYENGRYDLARKATPEALGIDPNNAAAQDLMATINRQATLVNRAGADTGTTAVHPDTGGTVTPQPAKKFLTNDDINEIRQLEMKPPDNLRVSFTNDVKKKFLASAGEDPKEFASKRPADQARDILSKGDSSLAPDVKIDSDPASLAEFHQRILPIVLSGCAASGCHNASTAAGGFGLYTGDETAAGWYTNFYLLQTYTTKSSAAAGSVTRTMIDRTYPEKSLLVQYGLPLKVADTPHPDVPNFRQTFTGPSDKHYQAVVHWMSESLKPDAGSYPDIHYTPGWVSPSTRPAGAGAGPGPATQPAAR